MRILRNPCWLVAFVACLTLALGPALAAQEIFADWTSSMGGTATFDLGDESGTVTEANPVNWAGLISAIGPQDGATNYPDVWYTPTPPVGVEWLGLGANNAVAGSVGSVDQVIVFSGPVRDPKFHFINLDNGTVDFSSTTTSGGGPVAVVRLSGNPEFEVAGDVANSTPNPAAIGGCEDAVGNNPNGGCGTLQLAGLYTQVTLRVTDVDTSTGSGDGYAMTMSIPEAVTLEIPTLGEVSLAILALLLAGAALWMVRRMV
jgi:hypothetical protein